MSAKFAYSRQPNARFRINESAFEAWLGGRKDFFAQKYPLARPNLKNAVCLALIDHLGVAIGYETIEEKILEARVVVDEDGSHLDEIPADALRIAISQVTKQLESSQAPYFIKAQRDAKNRSQFRLVQAPDEMARLAEMARIHRGRQPDGAAPSDIAKRLVSCAGGLPFAAMYVNYRAAATWICASKYTSSVGSRYEASALDGYGLKKLLPRHEGTTIGVVGLGVGEGKGEVAILRRLLAPDHGFTKIHYLAIDSSEMLLASHAGLVRDLFREEIEKGRLVFCPVQGDLFRLIDQVGIARERYGDSFLSGMSIIGSYLGNNFGNQEDHEWAMFESLFTAFPQPTPLAALLGVSLVRREGDRENGKVLEEDYRLDSLVLDTPRALIQDQRHLMSLDEAGNEIEAERSLEFTDEGVKASIGSGSVPSAIYSTNLGLVGRVYRFHYALVHALKCRETGETLPAGTRVHLASVVKYDIRSIRDALERKGLRIHAPPKQFHVLKAEEEGRHYRYVVIGATRS